MTPLWNPERLISLCSHEDTDVRGWAADRLAFLFPEKAAVTMLRLLADPDELVVIEAIRYFSGHPDKKFADELLAALKKSSGRIAGRLANAVALLGDARLLDVVREKYPKETGNDMMGFALVLVGVAVLGTPPSQEYVEASLSRLFSSSLKESFAGSFFAANLIAGTDMERLLSFCGQAAAKELLPSLLFQALSRCGSWVSKEDLTEKPAKGSKVVPFVIQDSLECLGEHGYPDAAESLERLFGKRRYDDIVRTSREICAAMLSAKRQASGEVSMRQWEERRNMPFPYVSLLSALDATLDKMPKGLKETIARTAVAALAGVAELQSLIAIDPKDLAKETALRLFLEDRPTVPQDRRIMEILAADGRPDTVIESCKNHLKEYAYSDAAPRIVDFLSRFMDEGLAGCFLDLDFAGENLDDAIVRAIGELGVAAIPLLRPVFEQNDRDKIPLALQVLDELPYQESVDLLLPHWSALWEEHGEWLLETVEFLGDRRFIPLLRKELKEGEPEEDRIFRLLCLINGVADPELKRIDREAEEGRQKEERVMEAIKAGDFETLLSEPLDVSLTCRACNSVFHYRVHSVRLGIDSKDVIIMDSIVCKKCGALDHYETGDDLIVGVTARLAMLDALPDDALPDPDSMTVIPVETISALGKGLSGEELLARYEKKLAKEPENAELILGYANVLRQMKRAEDAVPFYERVLERDPLAVEALDCLGDHAFFRGDFESAFARYGKAVEIMDEGHYYRVQADVDRFKEAMLDRLAETAERLGRAAPVVDAPTGEAESRKKVGRNDPCPCGSGKKYKKCCLLRESGQGPVPALQEPRRPVVDPVYQGLQRKLDDYSPQIASRKDFLRGAALYWNTKPKDPLLLPDAAEKDQGEFSEWFIHDFPLDSGKTVVESFLETRGSSLAEEERALVEALSKSYRSIYEVQKVREGSGVTIKDLFTGVEMDVEEISGSYSMVQWDVIHIRVYTTEAVHKFGGDGRILPRRHLHDLLAYLNDAYRDTRGGKPWSTFLKENSFLVGRFFDNLVENPPVFLTEEKHRVISSRAHFIVSNYDRARNTLVGQYDFGDPEEVRPQGIRLSWLKRGASKVWETGSEKIDNAIVTTSNMVHPSGRLGWTVLGTVSLHPDKLTLECMSRERLERGKKRLEQLIGGFIRHRADEFEDIHVGMGRVAERKGGKEKPVPDEKARAMAASVMKRQLSTWPDQRLPALNGKTPREAVTTNEGREKVLDLIKDFENMEARKKKEGQVSIDLGFLRKELGV